MMEALAAATILASNWDQISDMKDAKPCYQGGEQAMKMFELMQKDKGQCLKENLIHAIR